MDKIDEMLIRIIEEKRLDNYINEARKKGIETPYGYGYDMFNYMNKFNYNIEQICQEWMNSGRLMWAGEMPVYNPQGKYLWSSERELKDIANQSSLYQEQDKPTSIYNPSKELTSGFFAIIIKNQALEKHYPGGLTAFLNKHISEYNDHIVKIVAMADDDFDDVFLDLKSCRLKSQEDYLFLDAGSYSLFAKKDENINLEVNWLRGRVSDKGLAMQFVESDLKPFEKRRETLFSNNENYNEYLNDAEILFINQKNVKIELEDIFVYPDLKLFDSLEKQMDFKYSIVRGKDLVDFVVNNKNIIVGGADRSGKTVLLKVLYRDLQNKGFVPLFIDSTEIISEKDSISKFIDDCFISQYSSNKLEDYKQLQKKKKALLIDNLHKIVNPNYKNILINEFQKFSDVLVISVDEFLSLKDVAGTPNEATLLPFKHLILTEFGYEMTGKLIERWVYLTQRPEEDEPTLISRIKTLENSINSVLGNKLFAANSFVVISLLQIYESNAPIGPISGSYGHLYEFIIMFFASRNSPLLQNIFPGASGEN